MSSPGSGKRPVPARLLVGLALCIAALALLWLAARGRRPAQGSAAPAVAREEAAPRGSERLAPPGAPDAPEPRRSEPAEEIAAPAPPPDVAPEPTPAEPVTITLYGFARAAEGREEPGGIGISVTDRLGRRVVARAGPDGAYSLSGLSPGPHWISAGSHQVGRARVQLELDATEPERRLDLELALPPELRIRVMDGDGEPIEGGVGIAVATLEPPGEWFDEISGSLNNPFGVGQFWQSGFGSARLPAGYIGTLVLDVEPPVYVSLVHHHRVVATRRVLSGEDEVTFALERDAPSLQPGELRFHFIDSLTGERLECRTATLDGIGLRMLSPQEGEFHVPRVAPGWYAIRPRVAGYASGGQRVLVEPGRVHDLGGIALEREVWIAGEIVDEAGSGVAANLRAVAFDGASGSLQREFSRQRYRSEADGSFRIGGLARAVYLVSLDSSDAQHARAARRVDARAGPVEDVRLARVPGVPLLVRPSGAAVRSVHFDILDAAGELVLKSRLWSDAPHPIPLAPGTYTVVARVAQGEPVRTPVTLAADPVELALP